LTPYIKNKAVGIKIKSQQDNAGQLVEVNQDQKSLGSLQKESGGRVLYNIEGIKK